MVRAVRGGGARHIEIPMDDSHPARPSKEYPNGYHNPSDAFAVKDKRRGAFVTPTQSLSMI